MPDPGWVRDPSGRYQQRYFDGTRWTEHVADEYGRRSTDPVENAQRQAYAPSAPAAPAGYTGPGTAVAPYQQAATPPAPASTTSAEPALELSPRSIVGAVGGLIALFAIVLCPWFEDTRIVQLLGVFDGGLLKVTYFETGWIITIVAVFIAVGAAIRSTPVSPRWLASIPVGVCTVWAVVGTITLKSDLTGISFGFGFFVAVVGLLAATVAPFLPGSSARG